jgi:hypothetical protein
MSSIARGKAQFTARGRPGSKAVATCLRMLHRRLHRRTPPDFRKNTQTRPVRQIPCRTQGRCSNRHARCDDQLVIPRDEGAEHAGTPWHFFWQLAPPAPDFRSPDNEQLLVRRGSRAPEGSPPSPRPQVSSPLPAAPQRTTPCLALFPPPFVFSYFRALRDSSSGPQPSRRRDHLDPAPIRARSTNLRSPPR